MPIAYTPRDAEGRLRGLATVEDWTKVNAGRKGAAKSPWRFGTLHRSSPPRRKTSQRNTR